jgi:hypothetical protein
MLTIKRIIEFGFIEIEAPNGNIYYKKGYYVMIPYGIGWHFKSEKHINGSYVYIETTDELLDRIENNNIFRLPKSEENIYSFSKKNINTLLDHYFQIEKGDINWIYNLKGIELNQLECIVKKVSEHQYYLDNIFKKRGNTVSNYLKYGVDSLIRFSEFKGSAERTRITKELRALMMND